MADSLAAGELDRRVRIEREVQGTPTGSGEPTSDWQLVAEVWAGKRTLRASEVFQAQQEIAEADVRFRMRYRSDVFPDHMRIVDEDGREFDILGVHELGRRDGLELLTRSRTEELNP